MMYHSAIKDSEIRSMIRLKRICFGGNQKLKIYGTLQCSSGKRMKRKNRVFFCTEEKARENNYRPCGHCMKAAYQKWKMGLRSGFHEVADYHLS